MGFLRARDECFRGLDTERFAGEGTATPLRDDACLVRRPRTLSSARTDRGAACEHGAACGSPAANASLDLDRRCDVTGDRLAVLGLWMWEQNRFLQFAAAHPEYRQLAASRPYYFRKIGPRMRLVDGIRAWLFNIGEAGARTALAEGVIVGGGVAFFAWLALMIRYRIESRHLTWQQLDDMRINGSAACGPVPSRLRNACLVLAAVQCGFGLLLLLATIHAIVWEDTSINVGRHMFFTLSLCWIGSGGFLHVAREQSAIAYGLSVDAAATTFNPPARVTITRLAIALLPGVIASVLAACFVQTGLKATLVSGAWGWLWGIFLCLLPSCRRGSWPFGAVCSGALVLAPGTLAMALGFDFDSSSAFYFGIAIGGMPTALAFQGIVFDRVNPMKTKPAPSQPS